MKLALQSTLIKAIQEAMHETAMAFFYTDIGLQDGPALTMEESQPHLTHRADVTAIVSFQGPIAGGVHLSAPSHAAIALAATFAGEPIESFDTTAQDALGELTNILAGALKSRISDNIDLTPPRIVYGTDPQDRPTILSEKSTRCYFMTTHGPLYVEVFHDEVTV
ncbi:MAG: chemotaxis protein CheX [Magnetococcales bacterium]|nr:chemotaxis protein CheX [Magnetococcales bacterium]